MENKEYMTLAKKRELEAELEYLKAVMRPEVAEKIKIAREFGDISENSEYDAAKEEQAMLEGKISETEQKLRMAVIIDESVLNANKITIGSTIRLYDCEDKTESVYKIVGSSESDPFNKKISNESPVGKELLGKKKGDTIKVKTPVDSGELVLTYKITDIIV